MDLMMMRFWWYRGSVTLQRVGELVSCHGKGSQLILCIYSTKQHLALPLLLEFLKVYHLLTQFWVGFPIMISYFKSWISDFSGWRWSIIIKCNLCLSLLPGTLKRKYAPQLKIQDQFWMVVKKFNNQWKSVTYSIWCMRKGQWIFTAFQMQEGGKTAWNLPVRMVSWTRFWVTIWLSVQLVLTLE